MMKYFNAETVMEADSFYRRNLINCLSGYKSLNLIGTKNQEGITNLAPFSQIIHVGANPPLVGILFRPHTVKRDTLENILDTGFFSLNHVTPEFYKEAHWSSGSWAKSEFTATGLEPEYKNDFFAPFVKNSPVQIGCQLVEKQTLEVNQTIFLIGSIEHLFIAEEGLRVDGSLDLEALESVSVAGLDDYFVGKRLGRLSHAKVDHFPVEI
jgi:flavin reductase (DIM6/NTAB) family NADH-FMN oxidoreductase RutF